MIRGDYVRTVLHKELLDTVRDKKTLLMNIGIPVLIWPLMAIFVTQFTATQVMKQQEQTSQVVMLGEHHALAAAITEGEKLELTELPEGVDLMEHVDALSAEDPPPLPRPDGKKKLAPPEAPLSKIHQLVEGLVHDKAVDAVIAQRQVDNNLRFWVLYDETEPRSMLAATRLRHILRDLAESAMEDRLTEAGLDRAYIRPIASTLDNVAPAVKTSGSMIGQMLPLLLIVFVVLGGFYPAIIMTAGEKENGTLPTLLCAPINHLELLAGKYLAILIIALVGVSANIFSIGAVLWFGLAEFGIAGVSPIHFFYIFLALIPVAMLYTALFMTVAIFANSFREGQNLLSPITVIAIVPAYAALLPGIELTAITAITPGINITLLIKESLVGNAEVEMIFLTLISNLAWTFIILVIASHLFKAEQVLLNTEPGFADVFTLDRNSLPHPDARTSVLFFCFVMIATFYASGFLLSKSFVAMMLVTQLLCFGAVALGIARYFRMDMPGVFRLRRPPLLAVFGAILVGVSIFVPASWVGQILPPPEGYDKLLMEALHLDDGTYSLLALIFLIGVLPGVCEEIAFRGLILSGFLSGMRPYKAILFTGLCFAVAHFSIYKLLPLLLIGTILSYAAWRTRSIWVGIIIHVINNSVAVLIAKNQEWISENMGLAEQDMPSMAITAVAIVLSTIGVGLIHLSGREKAVGG
jgi:sodium transport system permease protein